MDCAQRAHWSSLVHFTWFQQNQLQNQLNVRCFHKQSYSTQAATKPEPSPAPQTTTPPEDSNEEAITAGLSAPVDAKPVVTNEKPTVTKTKPKSPPQPAKVDAPKTQKPVPPPKQNPDQSADAPKPAEKPKVNNTQPSTPATATSPPAEAPKTETNNPTYVKVWLMAGTVSGQQDLPVYLNTISGKPIARTASLKELRLPVGKHKLIIVNPKTDESAKKSFTVPSSGGTVIVSFNDL